MIIRNARGFLTVLGIGLGLNISSQGLANDCLSRYRQLIANQASMGGAQGVQAHMSANDKNDLEVSYVLEAAKRIESGEWDYDNHNSIEMKGFKTFILHLENPEKAPGYHPDMGGSSALLKYTEYAHIMNVASQKGFLCKNEHQNGGFFDSLVKIRRDIGDGILPSLVSFAEEQDLLDFAPPIFDAQPEEDRLFDLEDFSGLSHGSELSLTSLSDSSQSDQTDENDNPLDVGPIPEPEIILPESDLDSVSDASEQQSDLEDPILDIEDSGDEGDGGAHNSLPDPSEVDVIDLSAGPAITPSLEEREKTKEQHFDELDELYR